MVPMLPLPLVPPPHLNFKGAYSLLEVLVAMLVFGLAAMGITSVVLHSERLTHANLARMQSCAWVQGYLEQIRALPTSQLKQSIQNPAKFPLQTLGVTTAGDGTLVQSIADPLYLNYDNQKTLKLDVQSPQSKQSPSIKLTVNPKIVSLEADTTLPLPLLKVTMDFSYTIYTKGSPQTYSDSIKTMIAIF